VMIYAYLFCFCFFIDCESDTKFFVVTKRTPGLQNIFNVYRNNYFKPNDSDLRATF